MIELVRLEKRFGDGPAILENVNAVINDGDSISVIGPSGTGKSTLLRCINMLDPPTGGQILLDGEDITAPKYDLTRVRRRIGMVFQSFNLFGHMTVIENVMKPSMDLLHRGKQEAYDEAIRLLKTVGLAEKKLSYPDTLSGGQKQRVAIARTLAMEPDVILLDEPTSALDPTMVGEVQAVIRNLREMGKTMMIVTHEMRFAREICNRVFYMDEKGIYEEGTPEKIFEHPEKPKTSRFVRQLKVLELEITSRSCDFLGLQGEIERYCVGNRIPYRTANHLQLAFEESVVQLLLPAMKEPKIRVVIGYDETEETAGLTLYYTGKRFDLTKYEGGLAQKVLKSAACEMRYFWDETQEYSNVLSVRIRS